MTRIHECTGDTPLVFSFRKYCTCDDGLRISIIEPSLPDGQSPAEFLEKVAGGKSGLHRATCRLTAGGTRSKRVLRKVPQKTIPPAGDFRRVRVKRCGKSAPRPQ